jgi:hypothetical protein
MGGQRQITQVMALFDNWNRYVELLNTSLSANGTLNEKNDRYLESVEAHLEQLNAETERTYQALFDKDVVNGFVDAARSGLSLLNDFIEGIGGGTNAFIYFGNVVANVFNKQIAQGITNAQQGLQRFLANRNSAKAK